jgi:NAD-dependent deacetylase
MSNEIERLSEIIRISNNIVFFGGAGISTESKIPDFRSSIGLFSEKLNITLTPEQLLSHSFYIKYPEEFFNFYKTKLIYPAAKPNSGHLALAKLEGLGKLKAIITQNIDGLHQAAGSKNVFELHGSVNRNYCVKCHQFYNAGFILESKGVPTCSRCGGIIKPDVVLYEENLDMDILECSIKAISIADTLIVGGTSLVVYPATNLIKFFRGNNLILINKSPTTYDNQANLVIHDSIGKVLSTVCEL